ncbi:VOC family protein [Phyllobacterium sp. 22229]|uniref:VOC family protein n=1 Tax=Phyllobacterium sp. 22229 TaxID=3453895 RepID=UPI003F825E91
MKILSARITVQDLAAAAAFYRDVLQFPVDEHAGHAAVTIGYSRLIMEKGEAFSGVHHLAFGIAPTKFGRIRDWLSKRATLISVGDSDVVGGPDGWHSRSLYFIGPEGIILEYIAHDEYSGLPFVGLQPFSIAEVGFAVDNVKATIDALAADFGLPAFPPQTKAFAPAGDTDGLLILVDRNRLWFPTLDRHAARAPLMIGIDAPVRARTSSLSEWTTLVSL